MGSLGGDHRGVSFERGYEKVVRVRLEPIANPPADGPGRRCTMVQELSRTPAACAVDPLTFSPEYEILVASVLADADPAVYWIQDLRYDSPEWLPLSVENRRVRLQTGIRNPASDPPHGPLRRIDRRLYGTLRHDTALCRGAAGFRRGFRPFEQRPEIPRAPAVKSRREIWQSQTVALYLWHHQNANRT